MALRPYKFEVRAIAQRVDENGTVVDELTADPLVVFGIDGLHAFADDFTAKLDAAEEQQ